MTPRRPASADERPQSNFAKQNYWLQMSDINKRQPQSRSPGPTKPSKPTIVFSTAWPNGLRWTLLVVSDSAWTNRRQRVSWLQPAQSEHEPHCLLIAVECLQGLQANMKVRYHGSCLSGASVLRSVASYRQVESAVVDDFQSSSISRQ